MRILFMRMDTDRLKIFLECARLKNFSRAAEVLHLSQPSISLHIRQLEDWCGTNLFQRRGRRVELTEAGQLLKQHAQRILTDLSMARQDVQELLNLGRGRSRLQAPAFQAPTCSLKLSAYLRRYTRSLKVSGGDRTVASSAFVDIAESLAGALPVARTVTDCRGMFHSLSARFTASSFDPPKLRTPIFFPIRSAGFRIPF